MASERQSKLSRLRIGDKRRLGAQEVGAEPIVEIVSYQGVGETLRAMRQRMGLDLQAVAAQLRIRYPHLEAMEAGRFEELPGRIYAIGFLRTYAEYLHLDPDAVVEAFKEETSTIQGPGRLVFPIPAPETRTPRGWLIVLCLVVAGGLYGAWYYSHNKAHLSTDLVAPPPVQTGSSTPAAATGTAQPGNENTAKAVTTPVPPPTEAPADRAPVANPTPPPASAVAVVPPPATVAPVAPPAAVPPATSTQTAATPTPPAAPAPSAPMPAAPVAAPPAPTAPVVAAVPPAPVAAPKPPPAAPVPAAEAAKPATESAPAASSQSAAAEDGSARTFGSTEGNVRVVLRAHGDSWIDVRGANNEVLFPGHVLHDGDVYRVPNRADAVLWTGNLGALEVEVDGKALPRLGAQGEARRNFSLDPKKLLAAATAH